MEVPVSGSAEADWGVVVGYGWQWGRAGDGLWTGVTTTGRRDL